jgi:hypothetical protein
MSGGSLNYVYSSVDSAARDVKFRAETPLHHAFATHLLKVAKALHDLEWVWSGDYGPGDEVEAIRAVLGEGAELEAATERAEKALADLKSVLTAIS